MKKPSICCIIPAKGISKRIPGKNLKDLCGKPMIAYILETAKSVPGIERIIVSTDSQEIQQVAERYGAEAPFIRPTELTEDHVPTREVLQHALEWMEEHEQYVPDYTLLLYPTSPLLRRERIEEAVDL